MNPVFANPHSKILKNILNLLWKGRFVYLQLIILAGVAWLMWPWRETAALPNPPYPAYTPEPPDRQETLVLCPETLAPGVPASARVIIYDPDSGSPISGAAISLSIKTAAQSDASEPVFTGKTDGQGTVPILFDVPVDATGKYNLQFDIASWIGEQHTSCPVRVERAFRLDLTTDRATYAPGQTIHALLRAADAASGRAAPDLPIRFDVYDARDNRICSTQAATSDDGLALADCTLEQVVNEGDYRVVASTDDGPTIEHVVKVQTPLPLDLRLDVPIDLLLGAPFDVFAHVYANSQPVISATVQLEARAPGGDQILTQDQGLTNATGAVTLTLPGIGIGAIDLLAAATAPDGRTGQQSMTVPISPDAILLSAAPESDALEPGIENVVYISARYPDGTPAQCDLDLTTPDGPLSLQTDAQGRAEWRITPPGQGYTIEIVIDARDDQGRLDWHVAQLPVEAGERGFLLRPDRTAYHPGETMHVDLLASFPVDAVYLDLIWNGQPVAAFSALAVDRQAGFDVHIDPAWVGDLVLRGYALDDGLIADARAVSVLAPGELDVSVQAERAIYLPGETAAASVRVRDAQGRDAASVLTIAARNAALPTPIQTANDRANATRSLRGVSSTPRYAGIVSKPRAMPESIRQQFEAVDAARAARRAAFQVQSTRWLWGLVALAGMSWIVVLIGGWRGRWLNGRLVAATLIGGPFALALIAGTSTLLAYGGQWLFGPGALIVLGLGWLGALLALLVSLSYDGAAQVMAALLLGGLALGWGVREAAMQGGSPLGAPQGAPLMAAAGVTTAIALALGLLGVGCAVRRERGGALAACALIVLIGISAAGGLMFSTAPSEAIAAQDVSTPAPAAATPVDNTPTRTSIEALAAYTTSPAPTLSLPRFDGTLLWQPGIPTDGQGRATLALPLPQDAVEWQVGVLALTADGQMGFAELPLRGVDPLPVEFILPERLTVGDRVDVPVSLHNTAAISRTAGITVSVPGWARLGRAADVQQVQAGANEWATPVVPLDVREWGEQNLALTSWISDTHKTLTRTVLVLPDGKPTARYYNRLTDETDTYKIRFPWGILRGSSRIAVYVDPTWASMLARGLDNALDHLDLGDWYAPVVVTPTQISMPPSYPRAFDGASLPQVLAEIDNLALLRRYLVRTERLTPALDEAIARRAREQYQYLLTFETSSGGFSTFGSGEATLLETASALRSLAGLARLTPVDEQTIDRVARWLLNRQEVDGVWRPSAFPPGWERFARPELAFTAHVVWALIEAGHVDAPAVSKAIVLLAKYPDLAQEPYTLATILHALLAYQEQTGVEEPAVATVRALLIEMVQVEEGMALWHSTSSMPGGAVGESADLERTALAAWALIRAGSESEAIVQSLLALAQARDAWGTWGSPQTTAWVLRALDAAVEAGIASPAVDDARVQVSTGAVAGGERTSTPAVDVPTGGALDAGYIFYIDTPARGYNDVRLMVEGGPLLYQLVAEYVEPWTQVPPPLPEEETIALTLSYDRTSLRVGETALVTVSVTLNRPGAASLVELNLGLPPGVDWIALEDSQIAHYELAGSTLRVYLSSPAGLPSHAGLSADQPLTFSYRLRARLPSLTRTLPTWALDVANPQQPTFREPVIVEVVP